MLQCGTRLRNETMHVTSQNSTQVESNQSTGRNELSVQLGLQLSSLPVTQTQSVMVCHKKMQ